MKTILAFETSCPVLSVALGTAQGRVKEVRSRGPLRHSENLIPLVDRLLKKERISIEEIDAFAIDRGPGSFTGLRIGFSLLKGFLAARKRPCYGALSLDMMASRIGRQQGDRLGVLIDARREAIYSRFYRFRKGEWMAERRLEVLSPSELFSRLLPEMTLVGDVKIGREIHPAPPPTARTLVEWFQRKDLRLRPLKTSRDLIPLYFRLPEAEEKRRGRR